MTLVMTIVALLLGILGAATILSKQWPAIKPMIAAVSPFAGLIGVIGFVVGLYWLLTSGYGGNVRYLAFLLCLIILGLIFSLDIWKQIIPVDGVNNVLTAIAKTTEPFRGILGLVLLVLTILHILKI